MKKSTLALSSLFAVSFSGCTSNPTHQDDLNSITPKGMNDPDPPIDQDEKLEASRIDWLKAWWNKSTSESSYFGIKGLGLQRWFAMLGDPENNTEAEEDSINLWDTVGEQVSLADSNHPRIQKEANFYARNQRFLDHISERAEPYFNFVLGEVQRRNLPVELALLPAVESAYEPRATSPRRAAGLWQLIPGTARRWGLELNQYYDGRRDVFASTHAALDYLQKLSDDFDGDWLLAMAAYNCGEYNVARAIKKNQARGKPTDFWSLDLPSETRTFVPRILGLAALIAEPNSYGVHLKALRDRPVVPVKVDYQINLAKVAEIADLSLQEVQQLNPAYPRGKTGSDGGNLLLPEQQARMVEERLAAMDPNEFLPSPVLSDVTPVQVVTETTLNPSLNLSSVKPRTEQVYVVRRGDTLEKLARVSGVKMKDIIVWNHLKSRTPLHPGQRLSLSQGLDKVTLMKNRSHTNKHTKKTGRVKASVLTRSKNPSITRVIHPQKHKRS